MKGDTASKQIAAEVQSVRTPWGIIGYILKRSHKRRTLEMCVTDQGRLRVAAPLRMKLSEINDFIIQKSAWIVRQLERADQRQRILSTKTYASEQEFLFLGRKYPLSVRQKPVLRSQIRFNERGWSVVVPSQPGEKRTRFIVKDKLISWYRQQAKEILGGRVLYFARQMGLDLKRIGIRSQKSIWGSCHVRTRAVHLNWQLVMMPVDVIDYIVVHELAHLYHCNHSKRFWNKVAKVLPDFRDRQAWIKHHQLDLILP